MSSIGRISLPLLACLALTLGGCGLSSRPSTSDAEGAIAEQSRQRLSAPACEDAVGQEGESGETSFYCSAADDGRRIKLFVVFPEQGEALILVWPCAPANLTWKAIQRHPRYRCGVELKSAEL